MVVVVAFSWHARILGEGYHSIPACAFFFFLKWRLVRAYEFHSLYQDQSTVARRAEMTAAEYSLTSYV